MGKLILVPTPIGNLEDMTLRGLRILKEADRILAEDTRHTQKLLIHYQISRPVQSLHRDNEHARVPSLVAELAGTEQVWAVVSDAGTPGISDPGFLLVRAAIAAGIEIETLPGATAFVPALVCSGLPTDRFVFEGFLPPKKGRQTRLTQLATEERTLVVYESPHRLLKTLEQLVRFWGPERRLAVCRELSKLHEEIFRGCLAQAYEHYQKQPPRGEIVLIVAGYDANHPTPDLSPSDLSDEE
jgi:16S rRNA (cytidine1402-2'-O)-methyltransferase